MHDDIQHIWCTIDYIICMYYMLCIPYHIHYMQHTTLFFLCIIISNINHSINYILYIVYHMLCTGCSILDIRQQILDTMYHLLHTVYKILQVGMAVYGTVYYIYIYIYIYNYIMEGGGMASLLLFRRWRWHPHFSSEGGGDTAISLKKVKVGPPASLQKEEIQHSIIQYSIFYEIIAYYRIVCYSI